MTVCPELAEITWEEIAPTCEIGQEASSCEDLAEWVGILKCCGATYLLCQQHREYFDIAALPAKCRFLCKRCNYLDGRQRESLDEHGEAMTDEPEEISSSDDYPGIPVPANIGLNTTDGDHEALIVAMSQVMGIKIIGHAPEAALSPENDIMHQLTALVLSELHLAGWELRRIDG